MTRPALKTTELGVERRCPRCRQWWPEDDEFWLRITARGRSTWFSWCRACKAEHDSRMKRQGAFERA